MRSLSIRPDRELVARSIHRLQRAHPEATAEARRAYLVQGPSVLSDIPPPSPSPQEETMFGEALARAEATTPRDVRADPPPIEVTPEPATPADQPVERSAAEAPDDREPETSEQHTADRSTSHRPGPRPSVSHDGHKKHRPYLFTGIVSRDDRRYPRKRSTIDGISVKVLDTDPEPDADMAIYVGRRRVAKLKDWRPGWRARVRGRSGRYYEIVITKIEDRRETVHFGVRPAR